MITPDPQLAVLVLAAGGSSRLGQAKQLLMFRGRTLLEFAVKIALDLSTQVHVVLGAHYAVLSELIADYPIVIHRNLAWQEGIGSSIRCAVEGLQTLPDGLLIMLCDQPFIPMTHYRRLHTHWLTRPQCICATAYPEARIGVPALFPQALLPELAKRQGDQGAKSLFRRLSTTVISLPCDTALLDIDTPEDAKQLQPGRPVLRSKPRCGS